ncbi:uncharacterized protein LOC115769329 isoform X5 [Drosophila novamexicana]|uniref:uncharacterized protein LOC115769329 isoform X5 n=1 Tax=Drosophila novamexicana TaxID=47314 RepID=UPI0011E5D911|nr:uncharacterized protein LOC115769329 isoform X5 [Drosophila novamexicana]
MHYHNMGCVFESAREQPKQSTRKQTQNQCSRITSTLVRNIEIKDNYKQSHKTQTAAATATAKHLKAPAQVLLAEQQQQQFCQVAHDNKVALATRETILTINIQASRQPSTLQINCSNCYSRSTKITKNEQRRYRRIHWCQHHAARGCGSCTGRSNDIGAGATLAGISSQAQTDLANLLDEKGKDRQEQHERDGRRDVEQPLAYLTWRLGNVASAVVPITMSAAILSTLSTTLAAGYQYLAQHYKQYSQSFSFHAASSVVLMLCYLTTTSMAAATQSETVAMDKHPIIDWSKFDESSSDKEILDLLLEKKRYDKRLLPPVNDEDFCCGLQSPDMATNQNARRPHNRGTLTVNVNVLLLSLASPDESSLKYEVEFLLNQQWNDPRLQYGNKSHYDFLNALHHHDSIWTPDTYFIMHGDFKDPIIPMHFALRIFRNGTITYAMRRHLILSCQGSLHIFPFDDPKCSFSMESISYEEAQIKYVWKNDEDTLRKSPSLTTLNAYLIKNQTTACDQNSWRGNYSCLRVDLIFTRDRAFYFTTVFIPGIILVTSSFITFWLEWNAVPARSMIGVTTMLNFFTTSNGFRSTLPVVSNLTAMNVWDGVCMCFIYASLLEFVCVNYVGRKRPLHNVVYRPGENPVTQASTITTPDMAGTPLPKNLAAPESSPGTQKPAENEFVGGMRWQEAHGGIIGAAVQNLRARSIKRKSGHDATRSASSKSTSPGLKSTSLATEHIYEEPEPGRNVASTSVRFEDVQQKESSPTLRRSVGTSTPALVVRIEQEKEEQEGGVKEQLELQPLSFIEMAERQHQLELPLKPPRRKSSRSNSPSSAYAADMEARIIIGTRTSAADVKNGEKRRDAGAANEIVACTTCGSSNSPCTHSANNGCATETCFVQMRKKEPPHPIRVAKTIDVIARITFPTAYAIFLIFFFVHYKGFS